MAKKSKQYKLYLFDLDGTLLDSDELLKVVFHILYKKYKPSDFVIDDEKIFTFSGPQITETLLKEFPEMDQELMNDEWKKYSTYYYNKCTSFYSGGEELLRLLSKKGVKFGIITNKHRYATNNVLKMLKIDDLNIYCVCADEVKNLKPDPEGIYAAMKHFGIKDKHDVIYVGDSIFDYLTARNAGIEFGFVSWSPRKLPDDAKIDVLIEKFATFAEDFE